MGPTWELGQKKCTFYFWRFGWWDPGSPLWCIGCHTKFLSNSLRQSLLAVLVCPLLFSLVGENKGPMQDIWISNYWSKRANGWLPSSPVIIRSINEMVTCKQKLNKPVFGLKQAIINQPNFGSARLEGGFAFYYFESTMNYPRHLKACFFKSVSYASLKC